MKIALMQPYFFPYIGYFQLIRSVDKFIPYDKVNFIKKKWSNRNRILRKNAGVCWVTVPLKRKTSHARFCDIQICNEEKWREGMIKSLYHNYQHAPMFDDVFPFIESLLQQSISNNVSEMNIGLLKEICAYLRIDTPIDADTSVYDPVEDLLNDPVLTGLLYPGLERKAVRMIEIAKKVGSDEVVNAIGGVDLYHKEEFAANDVQLSFLQSRPFDYRQFGKTFYPSLSIIDVMMFNPLEKIDELLTAYDLI